MTGFSEEPGVLAAVRRILLAVLLFGLAGLGAELVLLDHYESSTQLIPLVLIALAFVVLAWHGLRPGVAGVLAVRVVMAMFLAAGLLGVYFHFRANAAFQREIDPSIAGVDLLWKVMAAKAPPALAPGSMTQLGLIGLAYVYRHPALARRPSR